MKRKNSFNVLDEKTEIFKKHFLEASAGTGKTFAIEHIFLRLLIERKRDTPPLLIDQILVVTFTNKAASELKFRIRNNIEKALFFLRKTSKKEDLPYLFNYLKNFFSEKEKTIKRLTDALRIFDQAQIYTIHSFCYLMLKQFSFEANAVFELKDENFYKKLKEKVFFDHLKYLLDPKKYSKEQILILLKKYKDISFLTEKFINFYLDPNKKNIKNSFFIDPLEKINLKLSFFDENKRLIEEKIKENFLLLEKEYKKNKRFKQEDLLSQISLLVKILNKKKASRKEFEKLLESKLSIFEFLADSNRKVKFKEIEKEKVFKFSEKHLYPLIKEVTDPQNIFFNIAFDILKKVDLFLKEEEISTYDAILKKMEKALKKRTIFQKKLEKKYKAALIDEFQDTDPVQWEIFKKIFLENRKDLTAFYLIGDPKQSIYSFRNADLKTYFKALNYLKKENLSFLDTNFRSSFKLTNGINGFFSKKNFPLWCEKNSENESIDYMPVFSNEKKDFKESCFHFFVAKGKSVRNKWPTTFLEEKFFFPYIAKEIFFLNKEKKIPYKEIAILVKDRFQASRIKRFLKEVNIPSFSNVKSSLIDSSSFSSLKEIFFASLFPSDISYIKTAILGKYIDLDENFFEKDLNEAVLKFRLFNKVLKKEGIAVFFKEFFQSKWKENKETVLETILKEKDLTFYLNTFQLIEILLEIEKSQKFLLSEIIDFFENKKKFSYDERFQINPFFFQDAVKIMTIHMSKGLEFEVVFALGVVERTSTKNKIEDKEQEEKLRQLYVAFTRAKNRLYVPIAIDETEKFLEKAKASSIELVFMKERFPLKEKDILEKLLYLKKKEFITFEILKEISLKEKFYNTVEILKEKTFSFTTLSPIKKSSKEVFSFSSFSFDKKKSIKEILFNEEEKDFECKNKDFLFSSENLSPGKELGTLVHSIFETLLNGRYENFSDDDIIKKVVEKKIKESNLESYFDKKILFLLIKRAFKVSLSFPFNQSEAKKSVTNHSIANQPATNKNFSNSGKFSIKEIPFSNIHTEVEFLFNDKDFIKGFIDLIFYHKNRYFIVDWKTNWLGNSFDYYSHKNLEKVMEENNYFFQAKLYTEALKKFLKIVDKRPFNDIFGGVLFLFLRGIQDKEEGNTGVYYFYDKKPFDIDNK